MFFGIYLLLIAKGKINNGAASFVVLGALDSLLCLAIYVLVSM